MMFPAAGGSKVSGKKRGNREMNQLRVKSAMEQNWAYRAWAVHVFPPSKLTLCHISESWPKNRPI